MPPTLKYFDPYYSSDRNNARTQDIDFHRVICNSYLLLEYIRVGVIKDLIGKIFTHLSLYILYVVCRGYIITKNDIYFYIYLEYDK